MSNAASIKQVEENVFEVQSFSNEKLNYMVDMFLGQCTCKIGKLGGPCKHQSAVATTFQVQNCWNVLPVYDQNMRKLLHEVAEGKTSAPDSWYQSLHSMLTTVAIYSLPDRAFKFWLRARVCMCTCPFYFYFVNKASNTLMEMIMLLQISIICVCVSDMMIEFNF